MPLIFLAIMAALVFVLIKTPPKKQESPVVLYALIEGMLKECMRSRAENSL